MGNLMGKNKKREPQNTRNDDNKGRGGRITSSNFPTQKPLPLPLPPQATSSMFGQSSNTNKSTNKYALIQDNFSSLEQVITAPRKEGLESSNLILGIDFTKSNEWTGATYLVLEPLEFCVGVFLGSGGLGDRAMDSLFAFFSRFLLFLYLFWSSGVLGTVDLGLI
ncbi:hypothetical protein TSUD_415110 [Trifolium subterraneum]|uniref:Copine C-terminal domain-containing protein n=1 Tax=Trifolium subterraneum TaxID=3900 RepID=A0A2Z6P5M8_TRISU|nr:hypothetical protein TSUD_415110 [Trifolium subterraneum]